MALTDEVETALNDVGGKQNNYMVIRATLHLEYPHIMERETYYPGTALNDEVETALNDVGEKQTNYMVIRATLHLKYPHIMTK